MKFNTPKFWYKPQGLISSLLTPFSAIYSLGRATHVKSVQPQKVSIPVICIGNLITGGSGKTPVVQNLISLIRDNELARNPVILTRGYGGDEDQLLSRSGDVIVAPNRAQGAEDAVNKGYDLILMDDGFQNPNLAKDVSFIVIDGRIGFGNQKLLPAGPLREKLSDGFTRADACIIIGNDTYGVRALIPENLPIFEADIVPTFTPQADQKYIGFCGLAHPDKFKRTLEELKINAVEFKSFPDHYAYTLSNVDQLINIARTNNARLITTAKDEVRLKDFDQIQDYLDIVPISIEWRDQDQILTFLKQRLTL